MLINTNNRCKETRIGSGIYLDKATGNYIKSNSLKALKAQTNDPQNRKLAIKGIKRVRDNTLSHIENQLKKKVPVKDRYVDDVLNTGKKSLSAAMKKNVANALDEDGNLRPGARDLLDDPEIVKSIPKRVLHETKKKAPTASLSTLLGRSIQGKGTSKKRMVKHKGNGLQPFGSGIAFI
eukprot:Lithocolla_globosa_v1_NODE_204_length_5187_cov_37.604053.p3 type:complete len:179 gc:universal NODE_204_length_5187_cov_37.604053:4316-3780(-)